MSEEIIDLFFNKKLENELNEKLMYRNYKLDYVYLLDYVNRIINTEYDLYIKYIIDNYDVHYLTSDDVLQYSDFKDATLNLCSVIKKNNDTGFRFVEIGKMLEDDGVARQDGAYRKYGENHAKTGENIGLLQKIDFTYYLSCLGIVFDLLTVEQQELLVDRLLLRNKLIKRLIYKSIACKDASYYYECGFLKESTIVRRKSNVKKLMVRVGNCTRSYKDEILSIKF